MNSALQCQRAIDSVQIALYKPLSEAKDTETVDVGDLDSESLLPASEPDRGPRHFPRMLPFLWSFLRGSVSIDSGGQV